jgi:hypothetical protein
MRWNSARVAAASDSASSLKLSCTTAETNLLPAGKSEWDANSSDSSDKSSIQATHAALERPCATHCVWARATHLAPACPTSPSPELESVM